MAEFTRVEREPPIAAVFLDRPKQLNALSSELMAEVVAALQELDADPEIRCIVVGGSERVFAAGADIGEMATATAVEMYVNRRVDAWDAIRACARRSSRPCPASASVVAASWRWHATSSLPRRPPSSASRRRVSASSPAPAARSASPAPSARRWRWT